MNNYNHNDHLVIIVGDIENLPAHILVELSEPDKLVVSVQEAEKITGVDFMPNRVDKLLTFDIVPIKQDYDRDFIIRDEPQPWKRKGKNGFKNRF